jgi:hypothetical protein
VPSMSAAAICGTASGLNPTVPPREVTQVKDAHPEQWQGRIQARDRNTIHRSSACLDGPHPRSAAGRGGRSVHVILLPNGNLLVPAEDDEGNLLLAEIGREDENYAHFLPFAEPGEDPRPHGTGLV